MPGIVEEGQVFRWRRHQLHVAPEGLVWTEGKPFSPQAEVRGTARYEEVQAVEIDGGGRSVTFRLYFSDGKPPWVWAKVPASEAEWAADMIRGHLTLGGRAQLPSFQQAVPFAVAKQDAHSIVNSAHRQVVDLLDLIILQAVYHRATDIHLEPFKDRLEVRYRIDGTLHHAFEVPAGVYPRLLTRLKVVAKLTVYQKDAPQEGRLVAQVDDRSVDLRVTLLPTLHGERTTIRLFDPANGPRALNQLGMLPAMQQQFEQLLSRPQGMILFTGPANSGKTTTMYAALKHLHQTQPSLVSIATVEDPIEYDLQTINQTQINPASGLTFAAGLRTVLRQDPEVIMIGEIRDAETAEIAVRAGLTGHLLLSTVHARSAPAVFVRLIEMGIEPFLVASSVTAVVAQRLVRVVCSECRTSYQPDPATLNRLPAPREAITFQRGAGCEQCDGTGYRGRTGVFQLLAVDDTLRELTLRKASLPAFEQTVRERQTPTLFDDGWAKVKVGITTVEELERVGVV